MVTSQSIENLLHEAGAAQARGDLPGALVALRSALTVCRQKPADIQQQAETLRQLGEIYADLGADRRARTIYQGVLKLMASSGDATAHARSNLQYCHVLLRLGDTAELPGLLASLDRFMTDHPDIDPRVLPRYNLLRAAAVCPPAKEGAWDADQREKAAQFLEQAFESYILLQPWPRQAADGMAQSALLAKAARDPDLAADRINTAVTICHEAFPISAAHLRVLKVALRLAQEFSREDLARILALAGEAFSLAEALRLSGYVSGAFQGDLETVLDACFEQSFLASLQLGNPETLYSLLDLSRAPGERSVTWAGRSLQRYASLKSRLELVFQKVAKLEFVTGSGGDRNTDLWEEARQLLDEVECQLYVLGRSAGGERGVEKGVALSFHGPSIPPHFSVAVNCHQAPLPIPLSEVQRDFLDDETALVQFGSRGAASVASVLRKQGCHSARLESLGGEIAPQIHRDAEPDRESWKGALAQLYKILFLPLEPYLEGVTRLIIAPEQQVPLEMLIQDPGRSRATGFSGCRFLGERFAFRYLPSPTVLPALSSRAHDATTKQSAAIAIFSTAREGNPIKQLYQSSTHPPACYPVDKATKAVVLLEASRCRILHLGAPFWIHPTNPSLSRLALAGGSRFEGIAQRFFKSATQPKDPTLDIFQTLRVPPTVENSLRDDLWAFEIRTADFFANLVICSDCRFQPGSSADGFPALARAFLQSGVPSVIGNLWMVKDDDRLQFLHALHHQLRSGLPKDQALLQARKQLMEANRDPFSWGSFVLFGLA